MATDPAPFVALRTATDAWATKETVELTTQASRLKLLKVQRSSVGQVGAIAKNKVRKNVTIDINDFIKT